MFNKDEAATPLFTVVHLEGQGTNRFEMCGNGIFDWYRNYCSTQELFLEVGGV